MVIPNMNIELDNYYTYYQRKYFLKISMIWKNIKFDTLNLPFTVYSQILGYISDFGSVCDKRDEYGC